MNRRDLAYLIQQPGATILPVAHDALSARLIERAGFGAYAIGGFPLIGFRHALPDIGLVSFGEMVAGVRDIVSASSLPVIVDADEGYGDVKNVARTVRTYEQMGVAAISLEDQVSPKRCGHLAGKSVVPLKDAVLKIRAAVAARTDPAFRIIARTDALAIHGMEDAIERAEAFANAGADFLFVEAPGSIEEVEQIATRLRGTAPLMINMPGIGRTPFVRPKRLADMGYSFVLCPAALMVGAVKAMQDALVTIRGGNYRELVEATSLNELTELFGIGEWRAFEDAVLAPPA